LFPNWIMWGLAVVISFSCIFFITFLAYPISIGSILYFPYKYISGHIKGLKGKILGIILGIIGVIIYLSMPVIISAVEYQFRILSF
jgi:uncharacterized SAM-binding protein YcdF (DUF218 family)